MYHVMFHLSSSSIVCMKLELCPVFERDDDSSCVHQAGWLDSLTDDDSCVELT